MMGHMETRQKEKKKNNLDGPGVRLSARWTDARRRLNVGRNVLGPDAEVHLSLLHLSLFAIALKWSQRDGQACWKRWRSLGRSFQ